jgi:hypothetical protein
MATTTTNFGWDIPQSTDLVKDGATAIAALGQDIDTALVDLKGGTSGQVLAKASGTDLDFSWVAQDDTNAIQNAIVDAKGDLISATANDTPARLAVGTNGHILTADSTTATGIKWAAPVLNLNANRTYVATQEGTSANNTYVDLATVQSVTVTTGTKALVAFTCKSMNNATTDLFLYTSFAISGATTLAASDDRAAAQYIGTSTNIQLPMSGIFVMTGLTAGSNTFTLKFKGSSASSKFWEFRHISVVDLGN